MVRSTVLTLESSLSSRSAAITSARNTWTATEMTQYHTLLISAVPITESLNSVRKFSSPTNSFMGESALKLNRE